MPRRYYPYASSDVFPLKNGWFCQGLIGEHNSHHTLVSIDPVDLYGKRQLGTWWLAHASDDQVVHWKKSKTESQIVEFLKKLKFNISAADWLIQDRLGEGPDVPPAPVFIDPPQTKRHSEDTESTDSVYFVRAGKVIKIGVSRNPVTRIAHLQASSSVRLKPLGTMDGGFTFEKELHKRFASLREHGEWFRAESELLEFIAKNAKPWPGGTAL